MERHPKFARHHQAVVAQSAQESPTGHTGQGSQASQEVPAPGHTGHTGQGSQELHTPGHTGNIGQGSQEAPAPEHTGHTGHANQANQELLTPGHTGHDSQVNQPIQEVPVPEHNQDEYLRVPDLRLPDLRVPDRWGARDISYTSSPRDDKQLSPASTKQVYTSTETGKNEWGFSNSQYPRETSHYGYDNQTTSPGTRISGIQQWGPPAAAVSNKSQYFTPQDQPPATDGVYLDIPRPRSGFSDWSSGVKAYSTDQSTIDSRGDMQGVEPHTGPRYDGTIILGDSNIQTNSVQADIYADQNYQFSVNRNIQDNNTIQPGYVPPRPESRNGVPQSPVEPQGGFAYSYSPGVQGMGSQQYPGTQSLAPDTRSHVLSSGTESLAPDTSHARGNSNLAPALMRLYEKYGIAALRLIYLQRTRELHRGQWNNSPHQGMSQQFLEPAMSPHPVDHRSPVPLGQQPLTLTQPSPTLTQPHQHITPDLIQNNIIPLRNPGRDDTLGNMQNTDFETISQPSPGLKQLDFNQESWGMADNQAHAHLSPLPSPMAAPVQQYPTHSPFQPDMTSGGMYAQAQDAMSHASSADFYAEEQYRKTPEVMAPNPPSVHSDTEQYPPQERYTQPKVTPSGTEDGPSVSSLPTTFGLSAMRSHPEYDSFLPPRKKSRFAFEAAERLLASFSNVVNSGEDKTTVPDNCSSTGNRSAINDEAQYDKLKAFSIHNQNTTSGEDISQADLLANNNSTSTEQLNTLVREESNPAGDIGCFQKDDSSYDPISMKELQSALLHFDANEQVGEDMFDFDKNEDLDGEDAGGGKSESQSERKKEQKTSGKGLGKHSKCISSKTQGISEPVPKANTPPAPPIRGRKPASKYSLGGIVCPRKAITKAWVSRQAKKNLELTPTRRILRTRVPRRSCNCADINIRLKEKSIKTLARINRNKKSAPSSSVLGKCRQKRNLVHRRGKNVSIELSVGKEQSKKVHRLQQKLETLIQPKQQELEQVEKELQMLDALNKHLHLGDRYATLARLLGNKSLDELEEKLTCRENVILVPKTTGGLKEVICSKRSKVNPGSRCFCQRPWRLAPVQANGRKQSNLLQCKCDAGHSFVVFDYQDMLNSGQNVKQHIQKYTTSKRRSKADLENSADNSQGSTSDKVDLQPPTVDKKSLTPSTGEHGKTKQPNGATSEGDRQSVKDIHLYKSTLPKKRGKLLRTTSLASTTSLSQAADKGEDNGSSAEEKNSKTGKKESGTETDKGTAIDRIVNLPAVSDSHGKLTNTGGNTQGQVVTKVTAEPQPKEGKTPARAAAVPLVITFSLDPLYAHGGNIAAFTEVTTTSNATNGKEIKSTPVSPVKKRIVKQSTDSTVTKSSNCSKAKTATVKDTTKTTTKAIKVKNNEHIKKGISEKMAKRKTVISQTEPTITPEIVVPKKSDQTDKAKTANHKEPTGKGTSKKHWETATIRQCPHCTYTTRVKSHLNRHVKIHDVTSQLPCPHCPKTFCERPRLTAHIRASHTTDGIDYSCGQCGKVYKSKEGLRVHIRRDHQGEHKYVCDVCGRGFQQIHQYEGHMFKHSGERPFRCDKCDKSFRFRNNRNAHQRSCQGSSVKSKNV